MSKTTAPEPRTTRATLTRRTALKGLAGGAALAAAPGWVPYIQAQSSAPLKLGFQVHRTGIGAIVCQHGPVLLVWLRHHHDRGPGHARPPIRLWSTD